MRRIPENFRRIERRKVRSEVVMRVLKCRPCRVDDERREPEEDKQRLLPPNVRPHGFAKATLRRQRGFSGGTHARCSCTAPALLASSLARYKQLQLMRVGAMIASLIPCRSFLSAGTIVASAPRITARPFSMK